MTKQAVYKAVSFENPFFFLQNVFHFTRGCSIKYYTCIKYYREKHETAKASKKERSSALKSK